MCGLQGWKQKKPLAINWQTNYRVKQSQLRYLNLRNIKLYKKPKALDLILSKHTHLIHLDLSGNYLGELVDLSNLTQLRYLDLGKTLLGGMNAEILEELLLNISNLTQLQDLNLGKNFLGEKLKYLNLRNLTQLHSLDLSWNYLGRMKLEQFKEFGLSSLIQLHSLNLSDNYLDNNIELLGLSNLTQLHDLDISCNNLNTALDENPQALYIILSNLTQLHSLNLRGNCLGKKIELLGLSKLTKLRHLDLSDNYLDESQKKKLISLLPSSCEILF